MTTIICIHFPYGVETLKNGINMCADEGPYNLEDDNAARIIFFENEELGREMKYEGIIDQGKTLAEYCDRLTTNDFKIVTELIPNQDIVIFSGPCFMMPQLVKEFKKFIQLYLGTDMYKADITDIESYPWIRPKVDYCLYCSGIDHTQDACDVMEEGFTIEGLYFINCEWD